MAARVFIDGEHGTTGLQIRARLQRRTDIELLSIPEQERRNHGLREEMLNEADVAILCLPEDASREAVAMVEGNSNLRIIDTSTAFRVDPDWVYGFAEMDSSQPDAIRSARLVANPGCFPTGAIGLIRPLRMAGIMPKDYPVSINAISGYTGGGKRLIAQMEDENDPDPISANAFLYGLTLTHKHLPEMKVHNLLDRSQGMIVQSATLHRSTYPETGDPVGPRNSCHALSGETVGLRRAARNKQHIGPDRC
ncbi:N-acetyl-gamma-glutamyl-phosphate reductase uncommon form [Neorhizobium sp. JUb45]|nr:N-acetyl-gamma-glutamyl-phosphate reductase uncommon form [Neorhizobium sp. JUb45]